MILYSCRKEFGQRIATFHIGVKGYQICKMAFYKITLMRSLIGIPHTTKSVVKSIGLGKRGSTVYRRVTPAMAGALVRAKELISVEVTSEALDKQQQRQLRKSNPGFSVEKRTQL